MSKIDDGSSTGEHTSMDGVDSIQKQIVEIFSVKLNREVPSVETDLVESGILDSLAFMDLLMFLERAYGIAIHEDMLEIDNFRSVSRIAEFVTKQRNGRAG